MERLGLHSSGVLLLIHSFPHRVLTLNAVIWMAHKWVFVWFVRFISKSLKKQSSLECLYFKNFPPLTSLPSKP